MNYKHVDLIAIGALLLAMAVFTHVRSVALSQSGSPRRIVFPQPRVITSSTLAASGYWPRLGRVAKQGLAKLIK